MVYYHDKDLQVISCDLDMIILIDYKYKDIFIILKRGGRLVCKNLELNNRVVVGLRLLLIWKEKFYLLCKKYILIC
jgi:hypothetical protein